MKKLRNWKMDILKTVYLIFRCILQNEYHGITTGCLLENRNEKSGHIFPNFFGMKGDEILSNQQLIILGNIPPSFINFRKSGINVNKKKINNFQLKKIRIHIRIFRTWLTAVHPVQ